VIFVTVGSMFPFDRLIRAVDGWAAANPGEDLLAQIGAGAAPRHMPWVRRMDQDVFAATVRDAELIVAHAGMGTVITAGRCGKPLVLLPRLAALAEQTTDHQLATANWLRGRPGIHIAQGPEELGARIVEARATRPGTIPLLEPTAPPEFVARLRDWLRG
jgi:UDP-N-acetylglucosamine transferase subunit ALG13